MTAVMLTGVMLLSACATGPDYQRPDTALPEQWPADLMASFELRSAESHEQWQSWWTRYQDPNLNALVERALDDSLQLRLQADRIRQARAQLGLADANRWPMLSGQVDALREQQSLAALFFPLEELDPLNQFALSAALNYELDLWGRLAREQESALAMLEQSVTGADAVRLNLVTDVVSTYFNMLTARQQLALAERTAATREETLALEQLRYDSGASDGFNVRQAEAAAAGAKALLPQLRQQLAMTENALALLAGYSPEELLGELDFGSAGLANIQRPQNLPAVMPSELLDRRPDIRAAEAALRVATAQIGIAEAQRLPSLNLTAMLGTGAAEPSDLFSSPALMWRAGMSAAGPLFDFGRSRAGIQTAEAFRDEAETQYEMTVLTALHEVRDALTLYEGASQYAEAVGRQVESIEAMLELAELRHAEGAISLYELLDAQRSLLDAELALAEASGMQLSATATLFKVLGGGWHDTHS